MKPYFTIVLMDWYYSKNDTQLGPIPTEELQAKIEAGEVLDGDLVWREGMSDWRPVASLDELKSDSLPTGAPPIPVSREQVCCMRCLAEYLTRFRVFTHVGAHTCTGSWPATCRTMAARNTETRVRAASCSRCE